MITNERQYRITNSEIRKFEDAITSLVAQGVDQDTNDALARRIQVDAMRSQLADLRSEVAAYEALKSEKPALLELDSFDEIPKALIAARIASGMTQRDLAKRLGIHEQQVQRYEASNYASASLRRINEVIATLGVGIREDVLLPGTSATPHALFTRLAQLGIDRDLVVSRILPPSVRAGLELPVSEEGTQAVLALQAASAVERVYGIPPSMIFASDPLQLNTAVVGAARFNVRTNANERRLASYTIYAHYLSRSVLQATSELESRSVPTDPMTFRAQVMETYGRFDFEHVLRYAWRLGVPVLPLSDPGAFHGAFWRINGRNVIVLKQRTMSASRWLVDLLHELHHASLHPERDDLMVVEESETLAGRKNSKEERVAVRFAVAVALNGREDELAQKCATWSRGAVERLVSVVPKIAEAEGVEVGILADYMAYRLRFEEPPINWWPSATNLQPQDVDPREVARSVLLEQVNLGRLDQFDRELLMRALSEPEA